MVNSSVNYLIIFASFPAGKIFIKTISGGAMVFVHLLMCPDFLCAVKNPIGTCSQKL